MTTLPTQNSEIFHVHEHYKEDMARIRLMHESGEEPREIVREITEATDTLVILIVLEHLKQIMDVDEMPSHMLLLAQGGYGRRELHPKSDIDLIFLHNGELKKDEQEVVKAVFRSLFDIGFVVGHCCRSFKEAYDTASKDDQSRTAMTESRFLAGDWRLFEAFKIDLWKVISKNRKSFIQHKIEERADRNARYGTTINITEPNVKESPGGLRDYHFGIWLGSLAKSQTMNLLHLKRNHFIDDQMMTQIEQAIAFMWRLRNDLHFQTGKEQDVLIMAIQNATSQRLGYVDKNGRLSEEQMMRDYYKHATTLRTFADSMEKKCIPEPVWGALRYRRKKALSNGFYLFNKKIHIPPNFHFFEHHPPRLIEAFIHVVESGVPLAEEIEAAIRDNLDLIDKAFLHHKETARLLRKLFSLPKNIEPAIQSMRSLGVLNAIFPEWRDIANLVRYDLVHRFTVDEHSLLCLYHLENLREDRFKHALSRHRIFEESGHRDLIRLAVMFHDIGKGRDGDHSEIGAKLINRIGKRLRYSEEERGILAFLIKNHLLMSHTAQHRDLADQEVTADFIEIFEIPEQINMLYLLTYVDLRSVSQEAMTEWKNNLLWQLYVSSRELLIGDSIETEEEDRIENQKRMICDELSDEFEPETVKDHLNKLPHNYLFFQTTSAIRQHLEMIQDFDSPVPLVRFYPHLDSACREMVLVFRDQLGLFYRLCSAVMQENFNIQEARLTTRADGIIANNIVIRDALGKTDITEARQNLLKERIQRLLTSSDPPPPIPKSIGQCRMGRSSFENHAKIFNDTSARLTVIVLRCADRRGLLQDLTSVFTEMNINIHFARIITEGNRVTDVFYIADSKGNKVTDPEMLIALQQNLLTKISPDNYDE
jgi:[protein-PII] uridylyltransferase